MSHPLVSVIIPTYKRTDFLKLTLESVASQSFQDFEILVIDDGTPTDSNAVLCEKFDKVKYIKIENSGGPAKPRNVGIREAKGKYIAFVDDDDLWMPTKLEKQVAVLENIPDFGLVHCCCQIIDEKGIIQNQIIGRPGSPNVKHGNVSMRMIGNWTLMMPTPIIRKNVLDQVGFFNEQMPSAGEDVEYWTRCSFVTKFYYLDDSLALYRKHSNNISANKEKYLQLPLYLKKVLFKELYFSRITKPDLFFLLNSLCQMQIKMIKMNLFKTIWSLFLLDFFWLFKKNNFKMLIYVLLVKRESI